MPISQEEASIDQRLEQAEARTEQAEARTEQAKTRIEQAEVRIEQAETRTEQAEVRTEQAETRTEQAKTRTEKAEARTEQAESQSEQAIRASELRYRRLFEAAQDGILILDADTGQVMDANPFMKDLLGYSQQEFLGLKLWEIGPFKGEAASKITFAELQQADRLRYEGLPLETKDGARVEVEFISSTYLVDEKELIQCNIRDITRRKLAEDQLLWKTAFFEAQVHSAIDGILIVDREGKKILQNQRMVDLWNIPQEFADEPNDRHQLDWVAKQVKNPEQFVEKVDHLYAHPDEISQDEVELVDGRFFDRYSAPVRGKDGKDYGRIWSFRDITERKRGESRFRRIVSSNAQGVIFWNRKGEISEANDAFLRLVRYTREDLQAGRLNWIALTPAEYVASDQRCLDEVAAHGACTPYEKEYIRKDGTRVPILLGAACFEDSPDEGVCFVVDLSERKKLEHQFLRAQRMESIGTLAGGIAHDLNNILAPIMMSIELLKISSTDPDAAAVLETIGRSAKRGADIVRQVLSFARGVEGERIDVQPKHLIRDLENIIRDTFPKDIRQIFSVPDDVWTILGDPTQVHQILLNLCVNARDAMEHGGVLSVGVKNIVMDEQALGMNPKAKPGRYVHLSVADTGTGIPADLVDKIFEPFFTTKELNKGTGLGLSTVMAIVKSHDGIINVYSEPGKGTAFSVYLPAMDVVTDAPSEPMGEVSLPRGKGETILVVDDEASILSITNRTLESFGYRVLSATDGAEAVAIYAKHQNEIAVVMTDMMMPIMDGGALIRILTRINPSIRIIATSGLSANNTGSKILGATIRHFLTKPFPADVLLRTVRAILDEA